MKYILVMETFYVNLCWQSIHIASSIHISSHIVLRFTTCEIAQEITQEMLWKYSKLYFYRKKTKEKEDTVRILNNCFYSFYLFLLNEWMSSCSFFFKCISLTINLRFSYGSFARKKKVSSSLPNVLVLRLIQSKIRITPLI